MSASSIVIAAEDSTRTSVSFAGVVHPPRQRYRDPRIRKMEGLIRHNPHLKLGLCDLAAAIALSPSRFSHLFKRETGLSPVQYLKLTRIQKAKGLLEATHLSIKEVAGQVGLDSSRLGKSFKETYGMTPLQYRLITYAQPADARLQVGQTRDWPLEPVP